MREASSFTSLGLGFPFQVGLQIPIRAASAVGCERIHTEKKMQRAEFVFAFQERKRTRCEDVSFELDYKGWGLQLAVLTGTPRSVLWGLQFAPMLSLGAGPSHCDFAPPVWRFFRTSASLGYFQQFSSPDNRGSGKQQLIMADKVKKRPASSGKERRKEAFCPFNSYLTG